MSKERELRPEDFPGTENEIELYYHCKLCLEEWRAGKAPGESPQSYSRLSVGVTLKGMQVWCNRHDCNVININYMGHQLPSNRGRTEKTKKPKEENKEGD